MGEEGSKGGYSAKQSDAKGDARLRASLSDNMETKLIDALLPHLPLAKEIRVAVAFLKKSGPALIEKGLIECCRRGGLAEFLIGMDFRITDADALLRLMRIGAKVYCYSNPFSNGWVRWRILAILLLNIWAEEWPLPGMSLLPAASISRPN